MEIRNRLLLVLMALSMMLAYDMVVNGREVVDAFLNSLVRVTPSSLDGRGVREDAPFMSKEGSLREDAAGVRRLVIRGTGDIEAVAGPAGEVALQYQVRTYGVSSRHVREFHEQVEVVARRDGDVLEIALVTPEPTPDVDGARANFRLEVPRGLDIEVEGGFGDIGLHGLQGDLTIRQRQGSVRVGEHRGAVALDIVNGAAWLNEVAGNVTVVHEGGRMEAILVGGTLDYTGRRSALTVDRAAGRVRAKIDSGAAAFYSLAGGLEVEAAMARVRVVEAQGDLRVRGRLSPVEVVDSLGRIDVTSDRADVRLLLRGSEPWRLDLEADGGGVRPSDALRERLGTEPGARRLSASLGGGAENRTVTVRVTGGDITLDLL